ncbi:MAG: hypothetical protein P0Y60_12295 [Candidatus Microbacterium colombiense]|nr:MAG: hypothetical protein P0Y60_12295 [Microbacterium sp.]
MRRAVSVTGVIAACIVVLIVIAAPFVFFALFGTQDGDRIAEDRVAATADALRDDLGYEQHKLDAPTLAAQHFESTSTEVIPVAWSGSTNDGDRAIIDVRIRAHVEAHSPSFGNGPANTEGSAERCYRFTLAIATYAQRQDLDCRDLPTEVTPPRATPLPELPADAEDRLARVMQQPPTDDIAARGRTEFADAAISIDATVTAAGVTVVAVGVAVSKDCIVMVRHPDGSVRRESFDRISLEPGEGGCTVALYTAPAL